MIRKRNTHSHRGRTFTREQCVKGGSVTRGYETADDIRERAAIDAKGRVLREGRFYTAANPDGIPWCKRRAIHGRTDQIEMVFDGKVRITTGETLLRNDLRWAREH